MVFSIDQFLFMGAKTALPSSLEKSKNVLEEKRKIVKRKICIKKTHTFTIIAINCVPEQLKNQVRYV